MGGYPTGKVNRPAAEMSVLFLPHCLPDDAIVLKVEVTPAYLDYLHKNQIAPTPTIHICYDALTPWSGQDVAWGWSDSAVGYLAPGAQTMRPDTTVVRAVNNRAFCQRMGERGGFGVPGSSFCSTIGEFGAYMQKGSLQFPLVIKPAFGSSGFGLQVAHDEEELLRLLPHVERYCAHGGLTVEPWCTREYDLSTGAVIGSDGTVSGTYLHRQWINRYGGFFGICIEHEDPTVALWKDDLERMTSSFIDSIKGEGYFGPVGIDSFVYRSQDGVLKLAAGIEINARYTMGYCAHQLKVKMAPQGNFLLRFSGRKKCLLPETYDGLKNVLGATAYNSELHEGILLLTPLRARHEGVWRQPQQSVFAIASSSSEQLYTYDRYIQDTF